MKRRTLKMLSLLLAAILLMTDVQMPVSAAESAGDTETVEEQPDMTDFPTIDGDRHGMWSEDKELTIVVFGDPDCVYIPWDLKALSAMDFPSDKVDICYVDLYCTRKGDLEAFIEEEELPDGITYCCSESVLEGNEYKMSAWSTLLRYTKEYVGSTQITTPSYVFTDQYGKVQQFRSNALLAMEEVIAIMDTIGYGHLVPDKWRPDCIEVDCEVTYDQDSARNMLGMINDFRTGDDAWCWNEDNTNKIVAEDLEELTYDYELEKVAMQRAAELIACFEHRRPDGFSPRLAFGREYNNAVVGENILFGSEGSNAQKEEKAFTLWKEENENYDGQGHRRNMLTKYYKAVGIAHVVYKGYHYWVQEFSNTVVDDTVTEVSDEPTIVKMSVLKTNIKSLTPGMEVFKDMKVGDSKPAPQIASIRTTTAAAGTPDLEFATSITGEWEIFGYVNVGGWLVPTDKSPVEITEDGSLHAIETGEVTVYVTLGEVKQLIKFDVVEDDATPSVEPTASASSEPSSEPGLSPTPAPSIQPTASETNTPKPTATSKPTATATSKPTSTPKPTSTSNSAAVGQTITAVGSKDVFEVTSAGSGSKMPQVAYKKTTDTKSKTVVVPSQIEVDGVKYQVTSIAAKAFKGNKKVTKITIPDTVKKIGASAFQNCKLLKNVTIGKGVTTIDNNAFKNCKKLKKITIKSSVITVLGKNVFKGIPKKAKIKVPSGRSSIYKTRFVKAGLPKSVKLIS